MKIFLFSSFSIALLFVGACQTLHSRTPIYRAVYQCEGGKQFWLRSVPVPGELSEIQVRAGGKSQRLPGMGLGAFVSKRDGVEFQPESSIAGYLRGMPGGPYKNCVERELD